MSTPIVINLDHSNHNHKIKVGELIQQACYDNLKTKIQSELLRAPSRHTGNRTDEYSPGSGLVYFIDGTRGAGKSTFLKTAYDALPGNGQDGEYQIANLTQLAYIDPSRIEENEIVLLSVLKALADKINNIYDRTARTSDEPNLRAFRDCFKKLAGGLSLFAKDHHQLQYLDPELFLDYGLNRAGHSKDLRLYLHDLFDAACQLLDCDALLLAFDDADTNSKHARVLLECIRNYLDTPRLIILVTGDMELYSLLVRDHFFDNLRHSQYDKDEERLRQRVRMVDHLEDQYLLKLFPIQRRTQLRPLGSMLEERKNGYILQSSHWQESSDTSSQREPINVFDELIRRGMRIKNDTDIRLYREFLLQQPLRSVLQLLSRCAEHLNASNAAGTNDQSWSAALSTALRESLRGMALGSLYKFGVDVDALAHKKLPELIDAVFELSLRDGDADTAAYLRPQTREDSLKNCFIALAAEVASQCANAPAVAIRYLLGGPGSVSLYGKELLRINQLSSGKGVDLETLKKQFHQYMGVGRRDNALEWARHATSIIAATHVQGKPLVEYGVICINKNKGKSGENISYDNFYKKSSQKLNAFALSLVDLSGSSSGTTYASIFNILGLIEQLLIDDVRNVLKKPYPPLSISRPIWGVGKLAADAEESKSDDNESGEYKFNDEFISEVEKWKTRLSDLTSTPSSVMLGKVWTRLYYSLEKSADALRISGKNAADIMEIFALCVINAFLVEEVEHHLTNEKSTSISVDRTNPQTSATDFIKNKGKIDFIINNMNSLPLTYAVASCPLILGLIQATPNAAQAFSTLLKYDQTETKKLLCSDEDWESINKFFIAGRKYQQD